MTRLAVVSAGLRSPSSTRTLADRLAAASERALPGPVETTVVEVREHAHGIADALLTGFPSGDLETALTAVQGADAVIVVTPTFQASYAGLFKSFVDLVAADTLRGTPVLLAATGGSERHSLVIEHALRPLFSYLGASTVPTGVYAATADFGADTLALDRRIDRAATELAALVGPADRERSLSAVSSASDDPLTEARRTLGRASGTSGDFGEILRSLGQE
ncbi:CE1759 family FMN reductase [Kytococcus sedentarius]|uniref:CE1759 family FMN reductase n=1 Tax=Kytococcus sedentarius TaxID=1276 RepID=UPI0035BC75F5